MWYYDCVATLRKFNELRSPSKGIMKQRICVVCGNEFIANTGNQKFCGKTCFDAYRKEYGKRNVASRVVTRMCRQCGQTYRRVYEKSGFCSISCGAKWNIEHGISDNWRLRTNPRNGFYVKCYACSNLVYVTPRFDPQDPPTKVCSEKCESIWRSDMSKGTNNPMYGRFLSDESLAKQKRTLLQNHGVTNAFFLSKHRTTSKAQQEIFNHLSGSLPSLAFESEKCFLSGTYKYFIDIFSEHAKMVVEYNGDYWHCNPAYYSGSFYHPRKQKFAQDIWDEDMQRMQILQQKGYQTFTIWESDYNNDKYDVLDRLTKAALSCSKI